MAFDSTAASPTANSYCSVAFADEYWQNRVGVQLWNDASTTNAMKEAALRQATSFLDSELWKGKKATAEQSLYWPRLYVVDRDGYLLDSSTIPDKIKMACSELAGELLVEDRTMDSGSTNIDELKIGPISFKFDNQSRHNPFSPLVKNLIEPYLIGNGFSPTVRT